MSVLNSIMSYFAPAGAQTASAGAAAQAGSWLQGVNAEEVLERRMAEKGNPKLNWRTSIVDLMKLLDIDPSLENRRELATELGYQGEKNGSAEMNMWLHKKVMQGIAQNGGRLPAGMAD
jgi:hypothetical protein